MITRTQAEALLTLAESLETCEQLGIRISEYGDGVGVYTVEPPITLHFQPRPFIDGMAIRLAVNALVPKQETQA